MPDEKEKLIELLNKALNDTDNYDTEIQAIIFKNTELCGIINSVEKSNNPNYRFEFITDLSDDLLTELVSNLDNEKNQTSFRASLANIKALMELNKTRTNKITLTENQVKILNELVELIKIVIRNNEMTISVMKERNTKSKDKYVILKQKIDNNEAINENDYDVAEDLVNTYCDINKDTVLDQIMTYLNEYNITLLQKEKEKPNIILTETEEPKTPEEHPTEIIETDNVPSFDPFNHHAFTKEPKKPRQKSPEKSLEEAEKSQKIKEILAYLGLNYDELDEFCHSKLLNTKDLNEVEAFAHFLKEETEFFKYIKMTNTRGITTILCMSNKDTFTKILAEIKETYNNNEKEISKIFKTNILLFTTKGAINYELNKELLNKYNIDIKQILRDCSLFLSYDNAYLMKSLEFTESHGIDTKRLLEKCCSSIVCVPNVIENNIKILETYGFDIPSLSTYSILCTGDLANKLDQFIEMGLNEYIHNAPSRASYIFQSLIIKKVYYAIKNNLPVWKSENTENKFLSSDIVNKDGYYEKDVLESIPDGYSNNEDFNEIIRLSDELITEEEITSLIDAHPILLSIEEGHRPALYTENPLTNIKLKTELSFGRKIISRLKTYRVFRNLTNNMVPDEEALLYALTYNSIIEKDEYDEIVSSVHPQKIGEKTL